VHGNNFTPAVIDIDGRVITSDFVPKRVAVDRAIAGVFPTTIFFCLLLFTQGFLLIDDFGGWYKPTAANRASLLSSHQPGHDTFLMKDVWAGLVGGRPHNGVPWFIVQHTDCTNAFYEAVLILAVLFRHLDNTTLSVLVANVVARLQDKVLFFSNLAREEIISLDWLSGEAESPGHRILLSLTIV